MSVWINGSFAMTRIVLGFVYNTRACAAKRDLSLSPTQSMVHEATAKADVTR